MRATFCISFYCRKSKMNKNNGCAVAHSNKTKALGIKMGVGEYAPSVEIYSIEPPYSISWLMGAISAPTYFTKSVGAMRIWRPRTPALI